MNVLVMGGSKFNGRHLVMELVRQGHQVTVFNRGVTPTELPDGVQRVYGDRKNHDHMREVFAGREYDCIQDISAYTLDDVQSVVELFTERTGHYIFASSAVVYAQTETYPYVEGDPLDAREDASDYSKNKQLCEAYLWDVQAQGKLPVTSTRYAMVYGPHNNSWQREHLMMLRLLQGRPALLPGTGNTLITVGHVDDQSRALTAMMGNPRTFGQAYTVTGPDCMTDNGYVRTLARIIGVEPRIIYVPPAVMDSLTPEQRRPLIQRVGKPNQHWSTHDVYSMEKMKRDLDFTHQYSFESGMRQTFDWFMAEGMDKKIEYDFSLEERLAAELGGQ